VARQPALVLGLPTGRTPVALYRHLVALAAAGRIDFGRVVTFNLDEFIGLRADDPRSYRSFMERHLFGPAAIPPGRVHFLDGAADNLPGECERYEAAIAAAGGIDLQLLGVGVNGHVGFNEPADGLHARSHVAVLHRETRAANAEAFGGDPRAVPPRALSMGMATILGARAIVVLATGPDKAVAVQRAIEGPVTTSVPASFLQLHPAVTWMLDESAASGLRGAGREAAAAAGRVR
jgi:glucosamine-6-phosphate deaminase